MDRTEDARRVNDEGHSGKRKLIDKNKDDIQQVFQKSRIEGSSYLEETKADRVAVALPSEVATSVDLISKRASEAEVKSKVIVDDVKKLNVDELCQWLKPKLDEEDWNDVEPVIRNQRIKGRNFLNYTWEMWKADGLPGGIADSLFQVAQGVLRDGAQTQEFTEVSFMDLCKNMPAPSSFARHRDKGCWVNFFREHPNKIICHRVVSEEPSIPVCLLNPIFTQFVHDLDNIAVSPEDCAFVVSLTDSMCGAFDSENDRMKKFIELFQHYTGWGLSVTGIQDSKTDGSYLFANGAIYCNLEVKVEKGSGGGDPYMQNIAYYTKSLPMNASSTQYPCFLLELCGTAFSVSGIVNTDRQIICDPLSPTYQLLCNPDFLVAEKMAKLFASLRRSLGVLRGLGLAGLLPTSPFPHVSSFHDLNSKLQFKVQYKEKMMRLLFCAKRLDTEMEVLIKFCSRYNQDVHVFSYSKGFAPALLSCQTVGNHTVVVMEKLALRALSPSDRKNSGIQAQINIIIKEWQDKHYVHGDFRGSNVMFDTEQNRVVVLDFDWAGIDGIDVYPPFMNPEINWPEGAFTGQPLRHAHDCYWLNDIFG